MPFTRERQARICKALEQNLQQWIDAVAEIEEHANPGNKSRALHLMANMMQAKAAIARIMCEDADKSD